MAKTKAKSKASSKNKVQNAAKRRSASGKAKKKSVSASPAPKAVAPAAPTAPENVYSATSPVANTNGSLVSPATWEQDQARLQASADDAETAQNLNEEELGAATDYESELASHREKAKLDRLQLDQEKSQFERSKADQYKDLNESLSYRGSLRGSAARRNLASLTSAHSQQETAFSTQDAGITSGLASSEGAAAARKQGRLTNVASRRGILANRAAGKGVYSPGSSPVSDTGITSPTATAPVVTPKPPKPPKPSKSSKPKKSAITNAAKRKAAAKKGKK